MKVETYKACTFPDLQLTYVLMISRVDHRWLFVRHRERITWELPAGHIEAGETAIEAARRELFEETGALEYTLEVLFDYSAYSAVQEIRYGRVYFADIRILGALPPSEIAETRVFDDLPEQLTYPAIQPVLWEKAMELSF